MIQTEYETLRRNIRERTDKREREREREGGEIPAREMRHLTQLSDKLTERKGRHEYISITRKLGKVSVPAFGLILS